MQKTLNPNGFSADLNLVDPAGCGSSFGENALTKWVTGFAAIAVIFGYLSINFAWPAAQTIALVSFFLCLLLVVSALFEKTASA